MKKVSIKSLKVVAILLATGLNFHAFAQQTIFQSKSVTISLTGTSTLHDWEMKGGQGAGEAAFVVDGSGKLTTLTKLSFNIPAKSLKSEHEMMDNNTYKALNADKFANMSFVLTSATVTPLGNNNYQISCMGHLTIAGTTKETDLVATGKFNPADNSLTVTGIKKMRMTDYNVKPPTVMMGTIKTGNDIAIAYNVRFAK